MYEIGPNSKPQMSLLCAQGLAERKGRLLPYQPLLWARSFRHTSLFNPHNLPGRQGLLFVYFGEAEAQGVTQ